MKWKFEDFKEGDRFYTKIANMPSWIEIMAIRGSFIMARRKRCSPFVQSKEDFIERLEKEEFITNSN